MVDWNDSINEWESVDLTKIKKTHDAGARRINTSADFSTVKYPKSETSKFGTENKGKRTSFWKIDILLARFSKDWFASS